MQPAKEFVAVDLHAVDADGHRGNHTDLLTGSLCTLDSPTIKPTAAQPFRDGIPDCERFYRIVLYRRPGGNRRPHECTQHGVHESSGALLLRASREVHRVVYHRRRRHAIEVEELIETEPDDRQHVGVELCDGATGEAPAGSPPMDATAPIPLDLSDWGDASPPTRDARGRTA